MLKQFGQVDGVPIFEATLVNAAGAEARVISWGATLRDLRIPHAGAMQRVVLGLNSIEDYVAHSPHMGAVAGRFANRIRNGRFTLDGVEAALQLNMAGRHTLHGGQNGFGKRPWKLGAHEAGRLQLTLHSPAGDNGFPGALDVSCVYTLVGAATLRIELTATTDAATVVNLATHSYFNLDGAPDVRDHELQLFSAYMTPVDADLLPTGEIVSVAGTPFDFRAPRTIRHPSGQTYDNNFVVARRPDAATRMAHVATLRSRANGLAMQLHSSEPAVQLYDAAKVSIPAQGLDGARYGAHCGVCLEPQAYPDAPNWRHFPSAALRPGETYAQLTEYRFS